MTDLTYNQIHFRIRSGDTIALNTDSGWAADEDTNATIDAGTFFRIRFRVTESADKGAANTFKLQYNLEAGGWNDNNAAVSLSSHGLGFTSYCIYGRQKEETY